MLTSHYFGLLLVLLAGILNGSFTVFLRHIKPQDKSKLWAFYSLFACILMPWIIFILTNSSAEFLTDYFHLSPQTILVIAVGGFIFGIGQIFFAYAIEKLGMAMAFAINLGVGTSLGSLFVVFYKPSNVVHQNIMVILAVLIIIASLVNYYFVGRSSQQLHKVNYHAGWFLALFGGIASGIQNVSFILALHWNMAISLISSFWIWPLFLLAASIPMIGGFLWRARQQMVRSELSVVHIKTLSILLFMSACFAGSLFLYSKGLAIMPHDNLVIGWPLFMTVIILTSQLWGWMQLSKETEIRKKGKRFFLSMGLLVVAIIILSLKP